MQCYGLCALSHDTMKYDSATLTSANFTILITHTILIDFKNLERNKHTNTIHTSFSSEHYLVETRN